VNAILQCRETTLRAAAAAAAAADDDDGDARMYSSAVC